MSRSNLKIAFQNIPHMNLFIDFYVFTTIALVRVLKAELIKSKTLLIYECSSNLLLLIVRKQHFKSDKEENKTSKVTKEVFFFFFML